ncbi:MAG: histidine kinase [Dokdonia sp.]|jgi:tetratricopeptide (TPR) repeat protein
MREAVKGVKNKLDFALESILSVFTSKIIELCLMQMKYYILLLLLCYSVMSTGQNTDRTVKKTTPPLMTLKGSVLDVTTLSPIAKVNIEVAGGDYTTTNTAGEFSIKARVGDEIVIRNAGFETVYYTVKDQQRIRIEVRPNPLEANFDDAEYELGNTAVPKQRKQGEGYQQYIDKALASYKEDAGTAIDYLAVALEKTASGAAGAQQRARAFRILGEVYSYWKQYDLAVSNYLLSLSNTYDITVEIALASAYLKSKNYQESLSLFSALKAKKSAAPYLLAINEGLGDALLATGATTEAINSFKEGVTIAQAKEKLSAATRLNAKIAEAYEKIGVQTEALTFYDEALEISEKENTETATRTKIQAADFLNRNQLYDQEIELRKDALEKLTTINTDTLQNSDAITPQKQNYKIANAYVAQQRPKEALPFFEKSIEEAVKKEDLIVEKDATRRLSELYRDMGDFDKAAQSYERYVSLVDQDYARKEQEIARAARFGKDIAEKQNRILSLEKDRELNESRYQLFVQEEALVAARNTRQQLIIGTLALVALLLMVTAFTMYKSNKRQKYANNILALRGLRSQMNPHFIFNALNSVNSFIATNDERTANKYLADFSSLMRAVLENSEKDFIPLADEIELLKKYTMLEHFRFKDKFDYSFTVAPELDVNAFEIPPMLLQPYVENAVWHGLRYKESKGQLHIHFDQKDANTALVTITDNGVGREKSKAMKTAHQKKQKSKGMGNIKKRIEILNAMYDDRVSVAINDVAPTGEGTQVTLTLKKE